MDNWTSPTAQPPDTCRSADVTIVHISDTHSRHDELKELPEADLLIHTGDFSNDGTPEEYVDFNHWLGKIKDKFPRGIYVVLGNHDFKFLDGFGLPDQLIDIMASDEERRKYMQSKLSNAVLLDNELCKVAVGANATLTLNLFASPWNPFQSSPTYPDRVITIDSKVKTDHDRVFRKWSQNIPQDRKKNWTQGEAWRYNEIPVDGTVDILLTHVPPFGVFDRQPIFTNWGSSQPLRSVLKSVKPRAHLFGHVHAQRGYWEKVIDPESEGVTSIIGGVQYATTTNEEVKNELMTEECGIQFIANTALMSDRTVQPFARKRIVGRPRLLYGTWVPNSETNEGRNGKWYFHGSGGGEV